VIEDPPWFAHWGNLLSSTKLQKLITFLVELRRPRDPLEVANIQDATLGIWRENGESFHNSKFNFIKSDLQESFGCLLKAYSRLPKSSKCSQETISTFRHQFKL